MVRLDHGMRRLAEHLVHDEASAEDLVQDAWVAALEAPPREVRDPRRWFGGVLRKLAARQHTRERRRRQVEALVEPGGGGPSEAEIVEAVSTYKLLRRTVDELREPFRTVVRRRYLEERSLQDIADELGRPYDTVKSQVRRGLEELRRALDKHHGNRAGWAVLVARFGRRAEEPAAATARLSPAVVAAKLALALAVVPALVWVLWLAGRDPDSSEPAPVVGPPARAAAEPVAARVEPPARVSRVAEDSAPAAAPAAAAEPAAEPLPRTRTLELVVRRGDGAPATNAQVSIWGAGGHFTRLKADASGHASFELPEDWLFGEPVVVGPVPGVQVQGVAEGEAWSHQYRVPVPPAGRTFHLATRGPARTIAGTVRDPSGKPIAGAEVHVLGALTQAVLAEEPDVFYHSNDLIARTGADGRYALTGLEERVCEITCRAPGFAHQTYTAPAAGSRFTADFTLEVARALRGTVARPDGRPAAGARVWVRRQRRSMLEDPAWETIAGDDGRFELLGVEPGRRCVFARDADDAGRWATAIVDLGTSEDGEWSPTLTSAPGISVRFVEPDETPASGLARLNPLDRELGWDDLRDLDPDGRVHFPHVPATDVALTYKRRATDTADGFFKMGVEPSADELIVHLEPARPERSAFRGGLLGPDGAPFGWATVTGRSSSARFEVEADAAGRFFASALPAGEYTLVCLAAGYGTLRLGTHVLDEDEELELGEHVAPPPEFLHLDWAEVTPGRLPTEAGPWLVVSDETWTEPRELVRLVEPLGTLRLGPGRYTLRPPDTGPSLALVTDHGPVRTVRVPE